MAGYAIERSLYRNPVFFHTSHEHQDLTRIWNLYLTSQGALRRRIRVTCSDLRDGGFQEEGTTLTGNWDGIGFESILKEGAELQYKYERDGLRWCIYCWIALYILFREHFVHLGVSEDSMLSSYFELIKPESTTRTAQLHKENYQEKDY